MAAPPLFDLRGQVALVTGSTRGIGWAAAHALARQGATVVLHGRSRERVDAAAARLRTDGLAACGSAFDVADLAASRCAFDAIERDVGPVDILFSNAGIQHRQALLDFEQSEFERVLFVDLTAQWSLARHAARSMVRRAHGRVIFTGSVTAILGRERVTAYTAAKGALHALVRQWATELSPHGVTVNAVAPGYIRTELTEALQGDADFDRWLRQRTPAARWGEPQDLGAAVAFLAAREAGFVTGQTLVVDGGLSSSM